MAVDAHPNILGQRYRLLNFLGAGGMGRVYRVIDRLTGQVLALKQVLIPTEQLDFANRTATLSDFRFALAQEFQLLASMRHPSVINVLDYGFDGDRQPFLTMELLENAQTIREAAQDQPAIIQVELLIQLLQALSYLHRRDVVHRDLKPSNVLVLGGRVKVLDFGISIMKGQRTGVSGTLSYMAPELLLGSPAGIAADLYAVGVMAFEILVGRQLFRSDTPTKLIEEILNTPLEMLLIGLEPLQVSILGRLLAKDPNDRYSSAEEVINDLSRLIHQPLAVETPSNRESVLQTIRLVGRDIELSQLSDSLQQTVAGLGATWLVGGESGIGKSRLLEELRTLALVNGTLVMRGYSVSGGSRPYEVWREPLRHLVLSNSIDDYEASILKMVIPDIGFLLEREIEEAPGFDSEATQVRLLSTIANIIKRHEQPMVILLENLHWADNESLTLLGWLIQLTPWLPLLIIGTYRDDEMPNLPSLLPETNVLRLKRLSQGAIAELSESMLGAVGSQRAIVDLLNRETEGNPFFIIEVVRALAEEVGQLDKIGKMTLPQQVFPGGVRRIVERRLSRISAEDRPLLELSAVGGNQLDLAVLGVAEPSKNIADWITNCANVAVIEFREGRWRFSHDKLRYGVLNSMKPDQLQGLHRRIAEAIEKVYPDSSHATSLAYHWKEAGDTAKECQYATTAAEDAVRSGAYQSAIPYLQQALRLESAVDKGNSIQSRLRQAYLWRLLAEAHYGLGELDKSRKYQEEALTLLGFPIRTTRIQLSSEIAHNAIIQGVHRILPAKRASPSKDQTVTQEAIRGYQQLVQIYYFMGDILPLINANLRALNLAESANVVTPAITAQADANMGISYGFRGMHNQAQIYNQRARNTLREVDDSATIIWVLQLTGTYDVGVAQWESAQKTLEEAVELADRIGHKRRWQEAMAMLTLSLSYQGQIVRAAQLQSEVAMATRLEASASTHAWVLLFQVESALLQGQFHEALVALDEVSAVLGENMSHISQIRVYALRALTYLYSGDLDAARQDAERALQVVATKPITLVYLLRAYGAVAEVFLTLWEKAQSESGPQAQSLAAQADQAIKILNKSSRAFPINQPGVLRAQGWQEWLNGNHEQAQQAFHKSLATAEHLAMHYAQAQAHYELARHLDKQDPDRQEHTTRAHELFTELGAEYQAARTDLL